MENSVLITHIGYLYNQHKKYAVRLKNKLNIGVSCKKEEENLKIAFYIIQELEKYYQGCSCLEDADLCDLITTAKTIIK